MQNQNFWLKCPLCTLWQEVQMHDQVQVFSGVSGKALCFLESEMKEAVPGQGMYQGEGLASKTWQCGRLGSITLGSIKHHRGDSSIFLNPLHVEENTVTKSPFLTPGAHSFKSIRHTVGLDTA